LMPIFFEYQRQLGLSSAEIFGIQSIYYISFCFLELPTGFLADRLGPRSCMRVGAFLHVLTHLLPVFFPNYWGFLAHWLMLALSRSLISGAASAYLYNALEKLGQQNLYKEAEGRARAWSLAAKVVGFGLCDLLVWQNPALTYWVSAAFALISGLIALRFPPFEASHEVKVSVGLGLLWRSPRLWVVMAQGVGLFTLTRLVQVNLFNPLLLGDGFVLQQMGRILAINTLCEALGAAYPKLFRRYCSDLWACFWLTLAMGICCAGLSFTGARFWWLNLFALVTGFAYPIQRQVMNEHITDSRYRASMLSAESLLDRGVCAAVAWALGRVPMEGFLQAAAAFSLISLLFWPVYFGLPGTKKPQLEA
jgi:MFS family permease